jgi:galactose oxidase
MKRREFIGAAVAVIGSGGNYPKLSLAAAGAASIVGSWSQVYNWPCIPIHSNLLPNGKVLSFANGNGGSDYIDTFVSDVASGQPPSNHVRVTSTQTNMFCAGHTFLSDGRLIVMGGHEGANGDGSADVNILNLTPTYDWNKQVADPMVSGRWYPSSIILQNGEVLVVGGERRRSQGLGIEPQPEVWQPSAPAGSRWRALTTSLRTLPLYSALYLTRNGRVFVPGPLRRTFFLDPSGTGPLSTGPLRGHPKARD